MSTTDYRNLPDDQLLMWYRNARTTGALCGGHGKAAANEEMCRRYATELTARGLEVPTWDAQGNMGGVFNGSGAY